ncbi:MAG: substrate-binding domain-containing protein [Kiritimatiellae bacterium]|nr:substrate-binding domain-containing protein [Kiritimatiellia bacterium]
MKKKVFIALRMSGIAGQDKYNGIFRRLGDEHDWNITLVRRSEEFTPGRVRDAIREGFDGFIVSIPGTETSAAPLADCDIPTVVMDIHDPRLDARKTNIVFIRNSADEIGRTAANYLMNIGRCRSYAFVHNPSVMEWSIDRFRAFRRTLMDHGQWCHELQDMDGLCGLERPVGVFAANDDRGFDVLEFCRDRRIRVPDDAIVLGINNDTLICENCRPRLSSIQPDFEQEGFLAADILERMMSGNGAGLDRTTYVGVKTVVRRDSTALVSPAGKLVQRAIAYIRRHAREGIGVQAVVDHLGCSRRLADMRFRELQGTSIGEAIITERLNEVKRLLTSTTESIESISVQCGYDSTNYLKNLFKKRTGITMSEWRSRNSAT